MELETLMNDFAAKVGLDELKPDNEGVYSIAFDNIAVAFMEDKENERMIVYAPIAQKPAEGADKLAETLLATNYIFEATNGATIALNLEEGAYVLQNSYDLIRLDIEEFLSKIEAFVNKTEDLRNLIEDFRPVAEATIAEAEESFAEMNEAEDFIRV